MSSMINHEEHPMKNSTLSKMSADEFLERLFNKYDGNGDGRLSWF